MKCHPSFFRTMETVLDICTCIHFLRFAPFLVTDVCWDICVRADESATYVSTHVYGKVDLHISGMGVPCEYFN